MQDIKDLAIGIGLFIVMPVVVWKVAVDWTQEIFEMVGFYGMMFLLLAVIGYSSVNVFQLKRTVHGLEIELSELKERLDKNIPPYEE